MGKEAYAGPLERVSDYVWRIPKSYKHGMRVDGLIYASAALVEALRRDQAPERERGEHSGQARDEGPDQYDPEDLEIRAGVDGRLEQFTPVHGRLPEAAQIRHDRDDRSIRVVREP